MRGTSPRMTTLRVCCHWVALITAMLFSVFSNSGEATGKIYGDQSATDRLLTKLYGEPRPDGVRIWHVPDDLAVDRSQGMPGVRAEVRPLIARAYRQGGVDRFLLVTSINDPNSTCHSCHVLIDAANFERVGGDWKLRTPRRGLTMAGSFGEPPKIEFRRLGPDEIGFALMDEFGAQGGFESRVSLYRASSSGFDLVLSADTMAQSHPFAIGPDDSPSADAVCDEVDYTFTPLSSTTEGLFDLSVLIRMGSRSVRAEPHGPNPCEIPVERSPHCRKLRTRAVFSGATYCQKDNLKGVRPALRLCGD